ncbi:MAG: hypothetical protein JOY64_13240 [Alphaproteobacteria bacterium]|nr:hypothetical protein [Alphaproteobacteria bacterium]
MTSEFKGVAGFASRIRVPVLLFAGTADEHKFWCLITKANEIAAPAKAANDPFELASYAGVKHRSVPSTQPRAMNHRATALGSDRRTLDSQRHRRPELMQRFPRRRDHWHTS